MQLHDFGDPSSSHILRMLLDKASDETALAAALNEFAMGGLTLLHLLAVWSPYAEQDIEESGRESVATTAAGSRSEDTTHNRSSRRTIVVDRRYATSHEKERVGQHLAAALLLLNARYKRTGHFSIGAGRDGVDFGISDTPLISAVVSGAFEMAELLLQYKRCTDVNKPRMWDGARPIDIATRLGHLHIACLLLEHGAEVSMF
jgi:hypothetical protein